MTAFTIFTKRMNQITFLVMAVVSLEFFSVSSLFVV